MAHLGDRRRRIGIYAGLGCVEAGPSLAAVAELLQAPVATSVSGKGSIPDTHPLAVGWGYGRQGTRAAEAAFKEVDLVLAVGVRFSEVSTANYAIPKHDVLIHVDVNPNNLGRNVPAHVALCADSRLFLDRLLLDGDAIRRAPCPALWTHIQALRQVDRCEAATVRIAPCVDPMFFLSQLRARAGPRRADLRRRDRGHPLGLRNDRGPRPAPLLHARRQPEHGLGDSGGDRRPAVRPDRQVVCVTGDGCFLMSAIETSTAARAGLPVKFFVLDDGAYHYMQMLQEPVYRRTTATEIARIDFAAFAQSMGLAFNQITDNADALTGVQRALATPGPVLTRVVVSYEGRELRWLNALRSQYVRKLPNAQKVRLAARIGVRALTPQSDSD